MRINVVINDTLVKEAFGCAAVSSKQELVELALREFVERHRR